MNSQDTSANDQDVAKETFDSIGTLLANTRIALGMEQREAASRMELSLVLIRALEEDDFQQLGAPVFVRGYLTRYARFLGLPEQQILDRYKRLGIDEAPPLRLTRSIKTQTKASAKLGRRLLYLLGFVIVIWLGWLGFQQFADHLEPTEALAPLPAPIPQSDNAARLEPAPQTAAPSSSAPVSPPAASSEVTAPPQASVPATEQTSAPASEPPPAAPTTTPSVPQLVLEFAEDCWVDIKDADGNRLAYGTMKANTVSTLSGSAPFSLVLGNSGAVQIKLNGQAVDPATYVRPRGVSRFSLNAPNQSG